MHKSGLLAEAKEGYLAWLEDHPDDVDALHWIALVFAEQGEWDSARLYLEQALRIEPENPSLYLHLANVCKAKGEYGEAVRLLEHITSLDPHFSAGFNNLGTVYFAQGKWLDAIKAFRTAIEMQADFVDAYYNMGLALARDNRREEAMNAYRALLEIAPEHAGGRFQYACLLMLQEAYQAALDQFLIVEREHPYHFETQSNLATCYLKLGWLNEARKHYTRALAIVPDDTQILYNLGVVSIQLGKTLDAIEYYTRCLSTAPDFFEARNNLAVAFLAIKNREQALMHFREALRVRPDNEAIRHIVSILSQDKQLSSSPNEYIQSLFDSYADHYDAHLIQALHYQVPDLIREIVVAGQDHSGVKWNVLDLGCGTGLCGQLFRPLASSLTGVDLSEKMLEQARKKHCYDQLIHADILSFLQSCDETFDLVIAGDVLVYFGDLEAVLSGVYTVLRSGGLFVFNVEMGAKESYSITESGRFAHSQAYLENLIRSFHFDIEGHKTIPLRTQNQTVVKGHLYLLKKGMAPLA